jgi:hypothetical protein
VGTMESGVEGPGGARKVELLRDSTEGTEAGSCCEKGKQTVTEPSA